jgi:hypothetical protein
MELSHGQRDLWDKIWKDKRGDVVIWQFPNAALLTWAAATFVSLFFNGTVANVLSWIGSAALIVWSLLEIFKGVNYFRRAFGLVVFIFAIASLIKSL